MADADWDGSWEDEVVRSWVRREQSNQYVGWMEDPTTYIPFSIAFDSNTRSVKWVWRIELIA